MRATHAATGAKFGAVRAGLLALAAAGAGCGHEPATAIRVHVPLEPAFVGSLQTLRIRTERCRNHPTDCRRVVNDVLVPVEASGETVFALTPMDGSPITEPVAIYVEGLGGGRSPQVFAMNQGLTRFEVGRVTDVTIGLHSVCGMPGGTPLCAAGLTCRPEGRCESIAPMGGPGADAGPGPDAAIDAPPVGMDAPPVGMDAPPAPDVQQPDAAVAPLVGNCMAGTSCQAGRTCYADPAVPVAGRIECCVRPSSGTCTPDTMTGCNEGNCRNIVNAGRTERLCCTGPTGTMPTDAGPGPDTASTGSACGTGRCTSDRTCTADPTMAGMMLCCKPTTTTVCPMLGMGIACSDGSGNCVPVAGTMNRQCCIRPE